MATRREKLTQSKFNAIKIMLNAGTKQIEVAEYLDVSTSTVSRVATTEDWEEWNQKQKAAYLAILAREEKKKQKEEQQEQKAASEAEKQPQVIEHRQNVTVQTTYYVSQKLDKIVELLTVISAKLAYVVDELTK